MEIIREKTTKNFILNAEFGENTDRIFGDIIENGSSMETSIFLGEAGKLEITGLNKLITTFLSNAKRIYEINTISFATKEITEDKIINSFLEKNILISKKLFSKKTKNNEIINKHLIISKKYNREDFNETILLANQMSSARYFQNMPANLCTTDFLVQEIEKLFVNSKNIVTRILTKNDLEELGMNLILAVNKGSKREAKVIVCEYVNSPEIDKKIAIVGKGIIFDTGGYDLKRGKGMSGMKYDMSGAIIAAHILSAVDQLNIKTNLSIILPITDNLIDSDASLPSSIIKSMDGRTVEIANTDAEGRLILADGLTYASRKIKANLLIDISTLTGSVLYALGNKYTGVWSSSEKNWNLLYKAAKHSNEKIWRMPLDSDYIDSLSKKTFADITSCSNTEYSDCNIAASWLHSFAEDKEYIHFDIAGTADIEEKAKSPMIKTIVEFIKNY